MTSPWWLRIYVAIYVLLIACIVSLVVPSCPDLFRRGPALSVGCDEVWGGFTLSVWGHAAGWFLHAGVVTLIGLFLSLVLKRQPTVASMLTWFSSGIAEWWYPLSTRGWSDYRSLVAFPESMFWLTMSLVAVTMVMSIPTGLSLSIPRSESKAPRSTRIALWTTGFVLLIVTAPVFFLRHAPLFPTPEPIFSVWQEDPTTIHIMFGCPHQPSAEVVQDPGQVVVSIRGHATWHLCARVFTLALDEPLGDRPLIDGAIGNPIGVENRLTPERP